MGHHRGRSSYDYGMARPQTLGAGRGAWLSRRQSAIPIWGLLAALFFMLGTPPSQAWSRGQRFALVVGVASFQDSAFEPLRYAASDARQMAAYLADPKGGGFKPQDITLLLNEQATKAEILHQTRLIVAKSQPQDTVLLYFSSHGAYTQEREASIVCHDSRATKHEGRFGPIVEASSVLSRDNLYRFLRYLPARKRAVVVDVCHGAEATVGLAYQPPKLDGFPPDSEAETGPDQAAGPGAGEDQVTLIMTSCLGRERAWESRQLGASIFSYYLLKGLRLHNGDLVEAFYYAQDLTRSQSTQEKGWCQMPYMVQHPPWQRLILGPPGKG